MSVGPLSLRRNFSWMLAGNVVNSACQWGVVVALAKLGNPEMVGRFALALAFVTPIIMFANLQLGALQATDAGREAEFGHYFALRLATTAVALAAIALAAGLTHYRSEVLWCISLLGLARGLEAISDVFHGFCQHHERLDYAAVSLIARGFLSLLFLGVGVALSGSLVIGLIGFIAARFITFLAVDLRNAARLALAATADQRDTDCDEHPIWKQLRPRWNPHALAAIARRALPLGVTMLLISLNGSMPRFFLEFHLGERELGVFASITYFSLIGTTVVSALGHAASPRLARYYVEKNDRGFRRLLSKMIAVFFAISLLGILLAVVAGRTILSVFYRPEYAEHASLFVGAMVACLFTNVASAYGFAATASRRIRFQPVALAAIVLVSLISCQLLIGPHGLSGAVAAGIIVSVVLCVAYRLLLPLRGRMV